MAKAWVWSVKSYLGNVTEHLRRVVTRKEGLEEALADLSGEPQKPKPSRVVADLNDPRGRAVELVTAGRRKYAAKDYVTAEKCFRSAMLEDGRYALAITYLGHALYRLGRTEEAVAAWRRAFAMEPNSEAGLKAYQKLKHMERQMPEPSVHFKEQANT